MDSKCSQVLPSVCAVLADPRQPVSDDTCLEKLLDWFKTLTDTGSSLLLLEENPCLIELILAVLKQEEPNPSILCFILKLTGIFAAFEGCFHHLQQGKVLLRVFGESGPRGSALWEDTSVRSGWVQGAYSMLQHRTAFHFLYNSGAVDATFALQGDRSLFVASGANRLLVRMLIFSVQAEVAHPLSIKDCDWPACARTILAHMEDSLQSHSASQIKHSLKLLTTLFDCNRDEWTGILWSRITDTIESLLKEEPSQGGHSLVDLLLSMARSPVFHSTECSLWKLVAFALKSLSPAQTGPLALGLLKLKECPQTVSSQALNILLQPLDSFCRAASRSQEPSGLLAVSPADTASVESLLSARSSCVSLLCQTLAQLEEIQCLVWLPMDFPHKPLLHSVVTLLMFCIGLAVPASLLGATISRFLIGCFRVQRMAFSLLGTLSRWTALGCDVAIERVFDLLLVYLESPDTSPTVLKETFQAALKWCQSLSETTGACQQHKLFLRAALPVLQKRMCSPSWEVRDSALEFLTLAIKHFRGQEWFWQAVSSSEVLAFAEGLLDDPESYVRASAVKALGQFSLTARVGSKLPGLDCNGSNKETTIVTRLLGVLSDTEGFPRRAGIGVFVDWLREGHADVLNDVEHFVSSVIQAVKGDLDWEVKVGTLELAEVFIAQTFAQFDLVECPYTAELPSVSQPSRLPELLQTFCRVQLFRFLFEALQDCDRPVALKACKILVAMKSKICKDDCPREGQRLALHGTVGAEEAPSRADGGAQPLPSGESAEMVFQDPEHVLLILESTDLAGWQRSLERSSDHLEKSPQSLLQDILSAGGSLEEHGADCY